MGNVLNVEINTSTTHGSGPNVLQTIDKLGIDSKKSLTTENSAMVCPIAPLTKAPACLNIFLQQCLNGILGNILPSKPTTPLPMFTTQNIQ